MIFLSNPVHPGESLRTAFLDETDWTAGALARAMDVPRARIDDLIAGRVRITPGMAARLGGLLGTVPAFWANLQQGHDRAVAIWDPLPS